MNILIVEDEEKTARTLQQALQESHYVAEVARDGEAGLEAASSGRHDLVILDLMLPGRSGLELLTELRRRQVWTPVLMLTAMNRVHDRVRGLQAGADDYLTKPFALAELLARVEAILRRSRPVLAVEIARVEDLSVDFKRQRAERAGRALDLTPTEFRLLSVLAEHAGRLVTRTDLARLVWGIQHGCETNLVDVAIRRLRQKVDEPFPTRLIVTVRGAGYCLRGGS